MLAFERKGEGPLLVLLHGMGIAHRMWRPQIEALSKQFCVIAPDLPGFGDSPRTGPFSLIQASREVASLIEQQSPDLTAHVCGLSLGGLVALQLALQRPQRVKSLFLASTSLAKLTGKDKIITNLLFLLAPMKYLIRGIQRQSIPDRNFWPIVQEDLTKTGKKTLKEVLQILPDMDLAVSEILVPTLVACGGKDQANLEPARSLARQLPHARFELVPEGGHVWNLECPNVFNQKVIDFITHLLE